MQGAYAGIIIAVVFSIGMGAVGGAVLWVIGVIKQSTANSKKTLSHLDECLTVVRRNIEIQEEILKKHDEMIRLLRKLSDREADPGHFKSTQS